MKSLRPERASSALDDLLFGALAHATRREILMVLHFRGGAMTAGQIAERFSCRWPTVTRHLGVLEGAGLVRVRKRGRERIYRLHSAGVKSLLREWLEILKPHRV